MPYRVYFAARYNRRDELNRYRLELHESGIEVTSRWLTKDPPASKAKLTEQHWRELAETDIQDIRRADALVSFAESDSGGNGGRHVEHGVGITLDKLVIVVGPPEHLFHKLGQVIQKPDWEAAFLALREAAASRQPRRDE